MDNSSSKHLWVKNEGKKNTLSMTKELMGNPYVLFQLKYVNNI